ncbi:MAG: hypothetical protein Q9226_007992 [Calogaya cf. arnoldii]
MSISTIGWQVDLPGLSSLVLNMGAAGLKKFAQAGVDVHTLLCMGEIAETCPACPEYRREINICRQQQRKQSIWLYKIVEIGTASNFIVDELLKKRAGENILALMSTVLPILSEEECDMFILKLFEACKVKADNTPGFGQLQAYRDATLPLARKTIFKDKVFQYQILLGSLLCDDPYDLLSSGTPNIESLVQILLVFGRLVEDPRYILAFHGWRGASWVIAYARHVLGLPVCILRTPNDPVPINGQYQNSRLLVYMYEEDSKCELLLTGTVNELIVPNVPKTRVSSRWMVDLDNVNVRELYLPHRLADNSAIPGILYSLTCTLITKFVGYFNRENYESKCGLGMKTYMDYCLPQIRRRALRIINRLGFNLSLDTEQFTGSCEEGLRIRKEEAPDDSELKISIFPGPIWAQCSLAEMTIDEEHSSTETHGQSRSLYFTNEGQRIVALLLIFAETAAVLAMSDWGKGVRLLSAATLTRYARTVRLWNCAEVYKSFGHWGEWTASKSCIQYKSNRMTDQTEQFHKYLAVILGFYTDSAWYDLFRSVSIVAMESEGFVMTRASAERNSIDFEGVIYNLYEGQIEIFGERRSRIQQPSYPGDPKPVYKSSVVSTYLH